VDTFIQILKAQTFFVGLAVAQKRLNPAIKEERKEVITNTETHDLQLKIHQAEIQGQESQQSVEHS